MSWSEQPPWLARFHATMRDIHREQRAADRLRDGLIESVAKEIERERGRPLGSMRNSLEEEERR